VFQDEALLVFSGFGSATTNTTGMADVTRRTASVAGKPAGAIMSTELAKALPKAVARDCVGAEAHRRIGRVPPCGVCKRRDNSADRQHKGARKSHYSITSSFCWQ
jgi:hypothetical protein